jgi:hypothetical protein
LSSSVAVGQNKLEHLSLASLSKAEAELLGWEETKPI